MKYVAAILVNLALVSNAWAMAAPQGGGKEGGSIFGLLLPMVIVFAIFYLLLIRPQQKQQKKVKAMLEAMKQGDQVITRGGIHGSIEKIDNGIVTLKIAQNVTIKINKEHIGVIQGKEEMLKK